MNSDPMERSLTAWLDAHASTPTYLAETMARTRVTRQRPAWTFAERWIPMQLTLRRPIALPPAFAYLAVLVLLALAAIAGAVLLSGALPRHASPFGLATNGLLAYDSGGSIFIVRPDGSAPVRLATTAAKVSDPAFSPDGSRLAFYGEVAGKPVLFASAADGSGATVLSTGIGLDLDPQLGLPAVSWSPESDRLVFAGVAPDGRRDIYVARADGSETKVIGPRTQDRSDPAWSPDGRLIAFRGLDPAEQASMSEFHATAGLYVIHPDGTGEREVAHGLGGSWQYRRPLWAPDPAVERIATNVGEPGVYDVAVFDVGTGVVTQLTPTDGTAALWPVWSPDGSRLAWSTSSPSGPEIAKPDGTDLHAIGPVIAYDFVWSPDGTSLFGWKADDPTTAVIVSVDGSKPTIEIPAGATPGTKWSWQRTAP
jgi:dipeptidyl aminopeptidase/acylaminoacyl peptidase